MEGKRVKFLKGNQKEFIKKAIESSESKNLKGLLNYNLGVSYSALKKYYNRSCLLPYPLFKKLCSTFRININNNGISLLQENWGAVKGGKKGIIQMRKKYPSQLKVWRAKGGKNSSHPKKIKYPKLNEKLAEFIGIYLGDGTMTNYFIRISGDYRYDLPYFNYISKLIIDLFGIEAKILKDKRPINTCYLLICSKEICSLLKNRYGINEGNKIKNKTKIPQEILKDLTLSKACLRGLIDTDGSISRRGRNGSQFCVQFTSHSNILLKQVNTLGIKLRVFTYITGRETGTNKWENIIRYFEIIGSSNLRHIVRFNLRYSKNKTIYAKEVSKYYEKNLYKNIHLPFKVGLWSSG